MNTHIIAVLGLILTTISTIPAYGAEICGTHTVVKGDSLRQIAKANYGSPTDYRYIFEENRAALGISPHSIPTGIILSLPCRDGFTATKIVVPRPTAIEKTVRPVPRSSFIEQLLTETASPVVAAPE